MAKRSGTLSFSSFTSLALLFFFWISNLSFFVADPSALIRCLHWFSRMINYNICCFVVIPICSNDTSLRWRRSPFFIQGQIRQCRRPSRGRRQPLQVRGRGRPLAQAQALARVSNSRL